MLGWLLGFDWQHPLSNLGQLVWKFERYLSAIVHTHREIQSWVVELKVLVVFIVTKLILRIYALNFMLKLPLAQALSLTSRRVVIRCSSQF